MTNLFADNFHSWLQERLHRSYTLLLAAGFEDRARASVLYIGEKREITNAHAIILDYKNPRDNEPNRSKILKIANNLFSSREILSSDNLHAVISHCRQRTNNGDILLVDISGMDRILIFRILKCLILNNISFNIIYTEAEYYYPRKSFFTQLKQIYDSSEIRLLNKYQELEKSEVIYSYDCIVFFPREFLGFPEPGRPAVLIAFLTFKRSRLQAILRAFEFSNRILIVSKPVRADLYWRKELLELINYDLIKNRTAEKKELITLDPFLTCKELESYIEEPSYRKSNIFLAPLGSKMQTVGAFLFWQLHPEISVIFSKPKKYFKKKYSLAWKDTFLISHEKLITFLKTKRADFEGINSECNYPR